MTQAVTGRNHRPDLAHDAVHIRAGEMGITVEELFARAFIDAGMLRVDGTAPYRDYFLKSGTGVIPDIVRGYCEKPLPVCTNPDCPTRDKPARFSKTNVRGACIYFCSVSCMDSTPTPPDQLPDVLDRNSEGMKILERIRLAISNAVYIEFPPEKARPLKGQPRVVFDEDAMSGMIRSLKEVGQVYPGLVRKVELEPGGVEYEILDGERRWRGVNRAEIPHYRAMLVDIDDEAAPFVVSVIANFNREGHTVLEEVDAIITMHEKLRLTMVQIANVMGKHPVNISQLYGLRRLTPEVRDMLDVHKTPKSKLLPKTAAIEIAQSNLSPSRQVEMALKMQSKELTLVSLRATIRAGGGGSGRTRTRGPEDIRSTVGVRLNRLLLLAGDLKMLLVNEANVVALSGYDNATRVRLCDDFTASTVLLTECGQLFATKSIAKE